MVTNPLTLVHEALWKLLESHRPFAKLVVEGNRIKYTAESSPFKRDSSVADLPEVRLVPVQTTPHLQRTSNSSSLLKRFEVQVKTGSQFVAEKLYPLEWEIYRALARWAPVLMALTWEKKTFVKLCRPTQVTETHESSPKTGPLGWGCIWACEVEMWFETSDLE